MLEIVNRGVRLAFIDEKPAAGNRGEPVLLIHGFGSTHAVNWVFPQWVKTLTEAGRRVIAFDNRGHGRSEKLYDPAAYSLPAMAEDATALLDHLGIAAVDVMGYSLGARIAVFLAKAHGDRVHRLILGGLGDHLVTRAGLPLTIAAAMEARALDELSDPMDRTFRSFAEATRSDLRALAACVRGAREVLSEAVVRAIGAPVLIAMGTEDHVGGDPHVLSRLFKRASVVDIPGRDHNQAVGDKVYKNSVLEFLEMDPDQLAFS
ncbi:MAG: alpha/beta hydrolase [Beijerinckiaceae bacterium]|nr:alpha/beta hydrolase [Beijerinckiaceae bacterium]